MTGTPIDVASLVAPSPRQRVSLPALVLPGVGNPGVDAYELELTALKVWPAQVGFTVARIGIRKAGIRAALGLNPAQLRELAEHLDEAADLLDPPSPEDR